MHLNSRGDIVAGNVGAPWVKRDGLPAVYIAVGQAIEMGWMGPNQVIGNHQETLHPVETWAVVKWEHVERDAWTPIPLLPGGGNIVRGARDRADQWASSLSPSPTGRYLCDVSPEGKQVWTRDNTQLIVVVNGSESEFPTLPLIASHATVYHRDETLAYIDSEGPKLNRGMIRLAPRFDQASLIIPVRAKNGFLYVLERTERLTLRQPGESFGHIIEATPRGFFPDVVCLVSGKIRVAYFNIDAELPDHLVIKDIDLNLEPLIDLRKDPNSMPTEPTLTDIMNEIKSLQKDLEELHEDIDELAKDHLGLFTLCNSPRHVSIRILGMAAGGTVEPPTVARA